jgi:hypothetical protein
MSGNFLDQPGNIIGTGLKRYTVRLNLDAKVKPWLKVEVILVQVLIMRNLL